MTEKICVILIGIRYQEGPAHLYGCHNDTINLYNFLNKYYENNSKFNLDYFILADTESNLCGNHSNIAPTKNNILNTINNCKNKYKKFIFHYSGHGAYIPDFSNDESDGRDEILVPYDYMTSGIITDDQLNRTFLQELKSDCSVRIFIDSCNSGTVYDLKNMYNTHEIVSNYKAPNVVANVIKLSGCKDNQYSYDVYTSGKFQGAFTKCFIKSMNTHAKSDLITLTAEINNNLNIGGWSAQTSKLTSSQFIYNKNTLLDFENIVEDNILLANPSKLLIGKKADDVQIKKILDSGYEDITSISMWIGLVQKYSYDKIQAIDQIFLFNNGIRSSLDNHNKIWYSKYTTSGFN